VCRKLRPLDLVRESLNVGHDGRADLPVLEPGFFTLQLRERLEPENAALRQQLTVLRRKARGRVQFTNSDRLFFIQVYRWFPAILKAMTIIRYWRWKSRNLGGRPRIDANLRALIRLMSLVTSAASSWRMPPSRPQTQADFC
jgi:hypothetical protein